MLTAVPNHIGITFDDALSVADDSNKNLTGAQKELLLWHWKLGHANLQCI